MDSPLIEEFLGLTLFVLMAAGQPPRPTKLVELDLSVLMVGLILLVSR